MVLKSLQINLHHCKTASANSLLKIEEDDIDVVLIQEPWVTKDRVLGLGVSNYKLLFVKEKRKVRFCILARNKLNIFLLADYSDADVVEVLRLQNKTSRLYQRTYRMMGKSYFR